MASSFSKGCPFFIGGKVVKGFGRGSKEIGVPTANFPVDVVEHLPKEIECGIYFGWANVNFGQVHKMVMSIGWNPYYKNKKKSMETHILCDFGSDFYGATLKVAMIGYIRPEKNFSSLGELIEAIKKDIHLADNMLDQPEYKIFQYHPFFKSDEMTYIYTNGHRLC